MRLCALVCVIARSLRRKRLSLIHHLFILLATNNITHIIVQYSCTAKAEMRQTCVCYSTECTKLCGRTLAGSFGRMCICTIKLFGIILLEVSCCISICNPMWSETILSECSIVWDYFTAMFFSRKELPQWRNLVQWWYSDKRTIRRIELRNPELLPQVSLDELIQVRIHKNLAIKKTTQ